jgi:glucosamine-6-phosphate deaminase
MNINTFQNSRDANAAAADLLAGWLMDGSTRNFMPAAGNTPLEVYRLVAGKGLDLSHLNVFVLDEYVGVPKTEPRNCVNLLRGAVQKAWRIPAEQFHAISSEGSEALPTVLEHEQKIELAGGLDVVVLGLGQNGHLGFNEPGSAKDSGARIVPLEKISVEANRKWFEGKYAPDRGVTVGLKSILEAKRVLIMAYGEHKADAVHAMGKGRVGPHCPASFLQEHGAVHVYLDERAASKLEKS